MHTTTTTTQSRRRQQHPKETFPPHSPSLSLEVMKNVVFIVQLNGLVYLSQLQNKTIQNKMWGREGPRHITTTSAMHAARKFILRDAICGMEWDGTWK